MPYNGSGGFSLAEASFSPNTVISSSVMNSDLSDIATNGLTNAVTKDGQTTITGAFKGASGSASLPMYSFSADTDSGVYRIGANNIGIGVNATKILDIATTGLTVTGTLASTGTFSPTGVILAGDGTVSLPAYSFTTDPDSGVYRIGANNLGVAVNATKVLDISTTGLNVIGTVSSNGAVFTPTAQAAGMVNGTIVESNAGNTATFAIKTLAGTDPSATDIVYFVFRNVTPGTGNYTVIQVTAALSLTVSSGSTLGTASGVAFKVWLAAFNDAGTVRLGVINTVFGTNIYRLGQSPIASSTAEGGAGGADTAQVFYTAAAVTSKAYSILGYAAYESGQVTAGSWAASPTVLQLFGAGVPLPGAEIQPSETRTGTFASGTTTIPLDNTIPQITEGDEYMTRTFTATSKTNIVRINVGACTANTNSVNVTMALFNTDVHATNAVTAALSNHIAGTPLTQVIDWAQLAPVTTSSTWRVRIGATAGTENFNGNAGAQLMGGVANSYIRVTEIMT